MESVTEEQKQKIIEMRKEGMDILEISDKVWLAKSIVEKVLIEAGIHKEDVYEMKRQKRQKWEQNILDCYQQHLDLQVVADILQIDRQRVKYVVYKERMGNQTTKGCFCVERNNQIEQLWKEGKTIQEICKEVQLTDTTVRKILKERGYQTKRRKSKPMSKELEETAIERQEKNTTNKLDELIENCQLSRQTYRSLRTEIQRQILNRKLTHAYVIADAFMKDKQFEKAQEIIKMVISEIGKTDAAHFVELQKQCIQLEKMEKIKNYQESVCHGEKEEMAMNVKTVELERE